MVRQKLKSFAHLLGAAALTVLALYGIMAVFSTAELAFGAPNPLAPLLNLVDDASVPLRINYQGLLRDPQGTPFNGPYDMTFRLYDDINAQPGSAIWSESHNGVTVRNGHFSVLLGDASPFSATLFNSPDRFIGVTVAPHEEMQPRQRFASVPYAIYADRAFSLSAADGDPHDAVYVDAEGQVGVGTIDPTTQLTILGPEIPGWDAGLALKRSDGGEGRIMADPQGLKFRTMEAGDAFWFRNAANDNTVRIMDNGNVGIGTGYDNPATRLHITGPEGAILRLNNTGDSTYMSIDSNEIDVYGNSSLHLNRNSTTAVRIGSDQPSDLDVNGNTLLRGNLTVNGNITNFTVEGPHDIQSFNNNPDVSTDLGQITRRICFLTRVGFGDLTGGGDNNVCRIEEIGGQWMLTADSQGSGNVFCSATCLSW